MALGMRERRWEPTNRAEENKKLEIGFEVSGMRI